MIAQAAAKARPADGAAALDKLLAARRFDSLNQPAEPVALYKLGGLPIATAENLMVLQAKLKAGKSAAIGAMLAATLGAPGDCLWFESSNPERRAVLHYDTEQSAFDHHRLVTRSMRRAGCGQLPEWLYSHHIKGLPVAQLRALVERGMAAAAAQHGGVHSCIVDGIADLCADVNDAGEANELVACMEALAMEYRTLIVCVLHENHGSDSGKTRGHLGSQLARKAETNLRLEKDDDGVTTMFADASRSLHIPRAKGFRFRWDDAEKAHVSVEQQQDGVDSKRAHLEALAAECLKNDCGSGLSWSQFVEAIQKREKCAPRTAEYRFKAMVLEGVIFKKLDRYKCS